MTYGVPHAFLRALTPLFLIHALPNFQMSSVDRIDTR